MMIDRKSAKEGNDAFMKSRSKRDIAKELPGSHEVKVKSRKQAKQSKATHSEKRSLKNKIKVPGVKESEGFKCPYCLERFTKAVKQKEDWIKCDKCKRWWHEVCTDYAGGKRFVCDFCR